MPDRPSPFSLLHEIAPQFQLAEVSSVDPWPFLPQDRRATTRLVARFESQGQDLVLKARTVEQRRANALTETQRLQTEFRARGIATASLQPTQHGTFLSEGFDPRDSGGPHHEVLGYILGPAYYDVPRVHFEVQEVIRGTPPGADADWAAIGEACGHLHRVGHQPEVRSYDPSEDIPDVIDTFLPNKFFYTPNFLGRRAKRAQDLCKLRLGAQWDLEARGIAMRLGDFVWRKDLTWSVLHGNLNCDNLILTDDRVVFIDFDEAGLGEISFDLAELVLGLEGLGDQAIDLFFQGYLASAARFTDIDAQALVDEVTLLRVLATGDDTTATIAALLRSRELLGRLLHRL